MKFKQSEASNRTIKTRSNPFEGALISLLMLLCLLSQCVKCLCYFHTSSMQSIFKGFANTHKTKKYFSVFSSLFFDSIFMNVYFHARGLPNQRIPPPPKCRCIMNQEKGEEISGSRGLHPWSNSFPPTIFLQTFFSTPLSLCFSFKLSSMLATAFGTSALVSYPPTNEYPSGAGRL